ncbi:ComEC/Rec2 family competence protein [Subtercola sp. PAMC28395]|uniref:ComEC/Rec2 family competence protein n=1 Tax=Subtercola sp. PAMC28395 TaxID=2846775 RepID=UPI001C0AE7D5|nr:ComEC/Rec2 family competence protein [Subtercola sp. PAMC28395]QWT23029.1 ComEC/Rec2 family competence protein [Subtercola sp. PAMC28395]
MAATAGPGVDEGGALARVDLRLVLPAAACWLVAALAVGLPSAVAAEVLPVAAAAAFTCAVVVVVVCAMHINRGWVRTLGATVAVIAASVALVCVSVFAHLPARFPGDASRLVGHSVSVIVTVDSAPVQTESQGFSGVEHSIRFSATATLLKTTMQHIELRMPVLVFLRSESAAPVSIGAQLGLMGKLQATDPGESVAALFFAEGVATVLAQPPWYLDWANRLRDSFRRSASVLPGAGAQLVPGLAIGDVSLVSDELNSSMITSGLSHLTAVSGANCAIVVAAIMLLGGAFRLSRRSRITLCLIVMAAFVVLVTPSPSVLRAAVMATIVLLALASGRTPRALPALALACVVMLVADPWLSRSYGLALSVLATGGLLLLTRPLHRLLSRWFPSGISLVIAVPLAAQLACQPVLVLLSPSISTYSVVANLLAEPAAPVATVIGLISCVAGAVVPSLASAGAWLTWVPASWIAGVATFFADLPGATLPWQGGASGSALVIIFTAAAFVAVFVRDPTLGAAENP